MAYPVTLNGRTYTLADFQGLNYVDGFPDALEDFVTEAGTRVTAAQAAQTAAEVAQAAAEAALDSFDDRFLGAKASDPTLDNDGNALTDGALYFDTTNNVMKVYDFGNTEWKQTTPTSAQQANIDTVAGISADVTTVASNDTNITTVATNIVSVNSFANLYRIEATEPTTGNDEGDLYFNTTTNTMRVYNGSAFQDVAPIATTVTVSQISDLTATASEINVLDGVTATTAELNYLDITTLGTSEASKAVTADANGDVLLSEELKAKSYNETFVTLSGTTPAVDCEVGNVFALTTSGNTTFTFSNPPATGTAYGFTLKVTAGGTHTLTWPVSVDWAAATAPAAPASGETNVLVFLTHDGGTTWYGFQAGAAMA